MTIGKPKYRATVALDLKGLDVGVFDAEDYDDAMEEARHLLVCKLAQDLESDSETFFADLQTSVYVQRMEVIYE